MVKNVDEANFQQEIITASNSKLVLVDFWAPWCSPCLAMAPELAKLAKEMPQVDICKINIDENQALAIQFSIRSIPTLMVFKDGKPIHTEAGLQTKDQIQSFLNRLI